MNQRIIVTGAGGRLGAALVRKWRADKEDVVGFNHAQLDFAVPGQIEKVLGGLDFSVLVNCAAQTNVDRCETHPDEAMRINAQAVGELGELCVRKGARCIHISTDYVFDGEKNTPYTEEDAAEPISQYGASKLAGEFALLHTSSDHLVARVSWVFGPDRPSFVDQMIQKARTETTVSAIADKIAVPTYTLDAARLLKPFLFEKQIGGVLHVCNAGDCTWQEYAQHAIDVAVSAGMDLKAHTVSGIRMADLKAFIAKRPRYSAMSTAKLKNITGQSPRDWREAVREYVLGRK